MEEAPDLKPWGVPPDEAYWQALLNEGEYREALTTTGSEGPAHYQEKSSLPVPEADTAQADIGTQPLEYRSACWERFSQYQAENKPVELRVIGSMVVGVWSWKR